MLTEHERMMKSPCTSCDPPTGMTTQGWHMSIVATLQSHELRVSSTLPETHVDGTTDCAAASLSLSLSDLTKRHQKTPKDTKRQLFYFMYLWNL